MSDLSAKTTKHAVNAQSHNNWKANYKNM